MIIDFPFPANTATTLTLYARNNGGFVVEIGSDLTALAGISALVW
jgi:hypothetical protein